MTTRQSRKKTTTVTPPTTATVEAPAKKEPATKRSPKPLGHVSFVGTGPGDASLLTVRAAELIAQADVAIIEQPEQAALVPEGVEGAIVGSALYAGAFTLPEAIDVAGRP